ncbi:ATP-binding protein [Massilia solisilvae]|uniref:histidine kinase n=1 Tax=Massilia solisilvae TaxID=1811225 RepID=A0ABT2BJY3_9BURK|nr:ATP-binding protein [Massilia solisilvae]MCS0608809.1 ATP-binding protein [Massilia solisilvae]
MIGSRVSLRGSIAARLALGYALLVALSVATLAAVLYFGTVGVLEHSVDARIRAVAQHLQSRYRDGGATALEREIAIQLSDRIDTDTEILVLLSPQGQPVAGNLGGWQGPLPKAGELAYRTLTRDGERFSARLVTRALDGGALLVVGRDLRELDAVRAVIGRALSLGVVVSLLLALAGALVFRRQLERRIGQIRRAARQVGAGDLTRRIAVQGSDEFARLSADINQMLDRIGELMEGVRHVSNSIAHDLRTPLGRVRARLETALQESRSCDELSEVARAAIEQIDELTGVFDKLLQIAAVESGVAGVSFATLDLQSIAADIVELYEPAAEAQGAWLGMAAGPPCQVQGDRQLIASALSSLIDNALKYGGTGVRIAVSVQPEADAAALVVRDDGPGVPAADLAHLCERFYRVDRSRHLPGNGLGLSIVNAIAQQHGGKLIVHNTSPGLEVRLVLPRFSHAA